jgi:L-asparaginase
MAVVIVSTGGTIASTENDGDGADPSLSGADLVAAVPELETVDEIRTTDFANVPSPHFTVDQMAALVETLERLDGEADVDGIVVTHGTDILEETAFFVACCYDGETPVAFTGAMRNPSVPSPDGPANLLASARVVTSPPATGRVLVVFNDRVHLPADATKVHSMNVDTFRSPEFGPVAVVDEDRVHWARTPERPATFDVDPAAVPGAVHAVVATADMPPSSIPDPSETDALCLAATGAGHIPPGIIPRLEALVEAGVPVVATTRCPEGRLARTTYGFRGSERTLRELGCYYSEHNLQKTRIETIVALAAGDLSAAFERHPLP